MIAFATTTVGSFLRQSKCGSTAVSPVHLLALLASLIHTSTVLMRPSSSNSPVVTTIPIISPPPTLLTPTLTTKIPTPTTPTPVIENHDALGILLAFGTLIFGLLLGLGIVAVSSRTDKNHPPPRRSPLRGKRSAPSPCPTDNDDPSEIDNGDSNSGDSGHENGGNGNGNSDSTNESTESQETDDSQDVDERQHDERDPDPEDPPPPPPTTSDETSNNPNTSQGAQQLHGEPDPEDPLPPPPTTFNDDDDYPRVGFYGPALSLLHFLLGAFLGLLARLVTMNAARYRQELEHLLRNVVSLGTMNATRYRQGLEHLFRNIVSRKISVNMGSFTLKLLGSSTIAIPYPRLHMHYHRPLVLSSAPPHSPRRIKFLSPTVTRLIFKYVPATLAWVSRTYIHLVDTVRPPVDWLRDALADDLARTHTYLVETIRPPVNRFIHALSNNLPHTSTSLITTIQPPITRFIHALSNNLPHTYTSLITTIQPQITRFIHALSNNLSHTSTSLITTIQPLITRFIHALSNDLTMLNALISLATTKARAFDAEHGSSLRVITGYSVLLLVVLEVYCAKLPRPSLDANATATLYYGHDIIFPFADVDLPLEDSCPLQVQSDTSHDDHTEGADSEEDDNDDDTVVRFPFDDVELPLVEAEPDNHRFGIIGTPVAITTDSIYSPFPFDDVELPLVEAGPDDHRFGIIGTPVAITTDRIYSPFPFDDVDLPLVEAESSHHHHFSIIETPIVNPTANNCAIAADSIYSPSSSSNEINLPAAELELGLEIKDSEQTKEALSVDCVSVSTDVEQAHVQIPEDGQPTTTTTHQADDAEYVDEGSVPLPLPFIEDFEFGSSADAEMDMLITEDVESHVVERMSVGEDSHIEDEDEDEASPEIVSGCNLFDSSCQIGDGIEEDPDAVLEYLADLFDNSSTFEFSNKPARHSRTASESSSTSEFSNKSTRHSRTTSESSTLEDPDVVMESLAGLFEISNVEEDPDAVLESLADLFERSLEEEEIPSSNVIAEEVVFLAPSQVSPRRNPGGVCIRAFTSCETFAAMFGFDNEKPLEFLRPIPARLERLLPPYVIFPHTPARYFTLGAPPATPTTPYSRWEQEKHTSTPFVASPFKFGPRTPIQTPPRIVIPSPTSSEGTQAPDVDESPAAIRARRLDRRWAKMMAKRVRNEARNVVPRIRIDEYEVSSPSIASDTSVRSFFDPHASINGSVNRGMGMRDADSDSEGEKAGPSRPVTTKWKPRSPGDPAPRERRRWRNKDVFVGAGEDESYGAVGVAMD